MAMKLYTLGNHTKESSYTKIQPNSSSRNDASFNNVFLVHLGTCKGSTFFLWLFGLQISISLVLPSPRPGDNISITHCLPFGLSFCSKFGAVTLSLKISSTFAHFDPSKITMCSTWKGEQS